jgi:hypothetical protein
MTISFSIRTLFHEVGQLAGITNVIKSAVIMNKDDSWSKQHNVESYRRRGTYIPRILNFNTKWTIKFSVQPTIEWLTTYNIANNRFRCNGMTGEYIFTDIMKHKGYSEQQK